MAIEGVLISGTCSVYKHRGTAELFRLNTSPSEYIRCHDYMLKLHVGYIVRTQTSVMLSIMGEQTRTWCIFEPALHLCIACGWFASTDNVQVRTMS